MIDLAGAGSPLTQAGFEAARRAADIPAEALWTVIAVETSGCGFLNDRRPKILFERHIFHRLTGGRFDQKAPDVSAKTAGGYGLGGAHQHERLRVALALDEDAALRSASWGLGQILGENFKAAGHASPAEMVATFVSCEDAQLLAMTRFIAASGLAPALRSRDWPAFAKRYNGPNYAKNRYDARLHAQHQKYLAAGPPDLNARAVQVLLAYEGYDPGTIDGVAGPATIAAAKAFQRSLGIESSGRVDAALLERLARHQQPFSADSKTIARDIDP
jgi:hypothetical protein